MRSRGPGRRRQVRGGGGGGGRRVDPGQRRRGGWSAGRSREGAVVAERGEVRRRPGQ